MIRAWLVRHVNMGIGHQALLRRAVELPVMPYPGMGVVLRAARGPEHVAAAYINANGAVVVEMEGVGPDFYAGIEANDAAEQFEYEIAGWERVPNADHILYAPLVPHDAPAYIALPAKGGGR